ncbi:hypothetical protein CapIbe_013514 [Capra ibex]
MRRRPGARARASGSLGGTAARRQACGKAATGPRGGPQGRGGCQRAAGPSEPRAAELQRSPQGAAWSRRPAATHAVTVRKPEMQMCHGRGSPERRLKRPARAGAPPTRPATVRRAAAVEHRDAGLPATRGVCRVLPGNSAK